MRQVGTPPTLALPPNQAIETDAKGAPRLIATALGATVRVPMSSRIHFLFYAVTICAIALGSCTTQPHRPPPDPRVLAVPEAEHECASRCANDYNPCIASCPSMQQSCYDGCGRAQRVCYERCPGAFWATMSEIRASGEKVILTVGELPHGSIVTFGIPSTPVENLPPSMLRQ